jgi:hypothetical protein
MTKNPKSTHYIFIRDYDQRTKTFDLYKSSQPLKCDRFFVVIQKYTWRHDAHSGKIERVPCRERMFKLRSDGKSYYLMSDNEKLLRKYVAHLGLDGIEIAERWSKEREHEATKEDLKQDHNIFKPAEHLPRDGMWLLEGRRYEFDSTDRQDNRRRRK